MLLSPPPVEGAANAFFFAIRGVFVHQEFDAIGSAGPSKSTNVLAPISEPADWRNTQPTATLGVPPGTRHPMSAGSMTMRMN